jgi:hypothetical protein
MPALLLNRLMLHTVLFVVLCTVSCGSVCQTGSGFAACLKRVTMHMTQLPVTTIVTTPVTGAVQVSACTAAACSLELEQTLSYATAQLLQQRQYLPLSFTVSEA